jgi:hypothetical protein
MMFSGVPHPHVLVGQPTPIVGAATAGLTGTYFQGANFRKQVMVRTDDAVDFAWGSSAPDPSLVHHAFSVRWTGQITPQTTEVYRFSTVADDGVRLWVGGKLIINDWQDQYATAARGSILLQAGQTYNIRLDYFENGDPPATVKLYWATPTIKRQIIPTWAFETVTSTSTPSEGKLPNTPSLPAVPSAPADLVAAAEGTNKVHLVWGDATGETGFVVQRSSDGTTGWTGIATLPAGQTQFDDAGLAFGTTYFYRVVATNAAGSSAASNVASAKTDGLVYGLTNNAEVEAIDLETGAATQVGTLAFGTAAGDRNPIDGNFYYIDQNTNTPRVAVWNPTTNTNTTLATLSLSGPVMRAAFSPQGVLYITAGNSDVYTINTVTGAATYLGSLSVNGSPLPTPSGDMAFAPNGTLYVDDGGALYAANAATLAATYIGSDGAVGSVQTAFGSDGMFYGTVTTGDLYRIDLNTGAATRIGNTGVYQIGDLAPTWGRA